MTTPPVQIREEQGRLARSLRAMNRAAATACVGVALAAWVAVFEVPTTWGEALPAVLTVAALAGAGAGAASATVELALAAIDFGLGR